MNDNPNANPVNLSGMTGFVPGSPVRIPNRLFGADAMSAIIDNSFNSSGSLYDGIAGNMNAAPQPETISPQPEPNQQIDLAEYNRLVAQDKYLKEHPEVLAGYANSVMAQASPNPAIQPGGSNAPGNLSPAPQPDAGTDFWDNLFSNEPQKNEQQTSPAVPEQQLTPGPGDQLVKDLIAQSAMRGVNHQDVATFISSLTASDLIDLYTEVEKAKAAIAAQGSVPQGAAPQPVPTQPPPQPTNLAEQQAPIAPFRTTGISNGWSAGGFH